MISFHKTLIVTCNLLFCFHLSAQNQVVYFKSGEYLPSKNLHELNEQQLFTESELLNGSYYRLIQFEKIPNDQQKEQLKVLGIELLNYMPRNAFYARFSSSTDYSSLHSFGILSVNDIKSSFKLSENLFAENYPHWSLYGTDQIELNANYFKGVSFSQVALLLMDNEVQILNNNEANTVRIRLSLKDLDRIYSLSCFYYFEAISPPEEAENLVGRTNHRSNTIATDYASGLKYDGTGVVVMMQDDGFIGDHIDYKGRDYQAGCVGCSSNDANNHGDHVAGTIMGAGNLNPMYRGMAFGADLLVYSSTNDNYDLVPGLYVGSDLVITSKSYSAGCNGGYDSRAMQLDQQINTLPSLMHVFSAGNSGASDCGYGAGSGWGNITGGHKSGKNVIAVGNLTSTDALNSSSSRGPATDGRIKPDICAVGTSVMSTISDHDYEAKTGTSMSCPGVAGSITQLYHAYKDMNGGVNPTSGLIKAAILNTADDLGNPGPDFKYGWGRINVFKAHELLLDNNYIDSNISQGVFNNHTITVPPNVSQLKIMLYWTDFEGSPSASIALVNDLNMKVIDPGLVSYDPWVLNSAPNAATLDDDAVAGIDTLNNMEQITIDNPLPGIYNVDIEGFAVPQGPQEYFIVYEFGRDEVTLTYPIGGEGFEPSTGEMIRWDAFEGVVDFDLEYSVDNGAIWTPIATVAADLRYYNWLVPDELSGEVKVKVTRGLQTDQSDEVLSIIGTPSNLDVVWACSDSLSFVWDSVPGATSYEVSMLGTKYMDSIGTSLTTNLTILAQSADENWFSVRAYGPAGARGERAVALRKLPGQFNCLWSPPVADISVACDSSGSMSCVQVFDQSMNTDSTATYMWYFPGGTPATSTDQNPIVCYSSTGLQDAALVVTNGFGTDSSYFSNYVFVQGALTLPYFEGFETIPSFNNQEIWSVYNPGSNGTWMITGLTSLSGARCARLNNYNQNAGNIDELISGPIDLSALDSTNIMTLSFRYSYRKRDFASFDKLRVYVKAGCGDSWILRKTMTANMMSQDEYNPVWIPSDTSDWTTVHMTNITSMFFTNDFRYKFNFEAGEGNYFYLDNINMYEGAPSNEIVAVDELSGELSDFSLYPNPVADELNLGFALQNNERILVSIQDLRGSIVQEHLIQGAVGNNLVVLDTKNLSSGVYILQVLSENVQRIEQFVVK